MKKHFILVIIFCIACFSGFAQSSITIEPTTNNQLKLRGNGNGGYWPSIIGYRSLGTSAAPIAVNKDNWLLSIDGSGYNGSVYSNAGGGGNTAIQIVADENFTPTANGTYLRFSTITKGTVSLPTERMRINSDGNVGIGSTTPNAPLQLANTLANRKIVLYETANDDHQYVGLGSTSGEFRYQSNRPGTSHVFYSAINSTSSKELMRIKGDGNVGIGNSNPTTAKLVIGGTAASQGLDLSTADQYANVRVLQNTNGTADKDIYMGYGSGGTSSLHLYSNNTEVMTVKNGKVGIFNNNPSGLLHFDDGLRTRKIVLYDDGDNDNTFAGFGINPGTFRYQIENTTSSHVFYAGVNTTTSNELMRIKGNGNVGIGNATPGFPLNFASSTGDKISLFGNSGNHYGFGIQGNALQIHTDLAASNILFGYGNSASFTETMRIKGNGNVGIGTANPVNKLDVLGTIRAYEMVVEIGWADYVFDEKFKLKPLNEVENFIKTNKHLPDVPSAKYLQENGGKVSELMTKMMQKIEELTLYSIQQEKKIEDLEKRFEQKK
ncbi:hypothetical protein [Emticicia sp. SJ17W-69]|uniref:hypothetical protein n=1 Tax=Emticicia sp. SJ17W-69 TaxID=3421657 RepID=UPI003EBE06FE